MRKLMMAAFPVFVLSLVGCGASNPPAQVATPSQEQIDAEERHNQEVSAVEKMREEMLPKAVYIPSEEAAVNEAESRHEKLLPNAIYIDANEAAVNAAEGAREAALHEAKRAQKAPSQRKK